MDKAIIAIVKKYKDVRKAVDDLTETYSNYRWTVIFYPENIRGDHWHQSTCAVNSNPHIEGSIHILRSLGNEKHILIAWELLSPFVTYTNYDDINLDINLNFYDFRANELCKQVNDDIFYRNHRIKKLRFSLTLADNHVDRQGLSKYAYHCVAIMHEHWTWGWLFSGGSYAKLKNYTLGPLA